MVFKTFACDDEAVEGENFLRADYRLSCKSEKHTFFMTYAGIMILVRTRSHVVVANWYYNIYDTLRAFYGCFRPALIALQIAFKSHRIISLFQYDCRFFCLTESENFNFGFHDFEHAFPLTSDCAKAWSSRIMFFRPSKTLVRR